MEKAKLLKWIKDYRKSIIDPDNVGNTDEDMMNEGEQAQLQLLGELKEFVTKLN